MILLKFFSVIRMKLFFSAMVLKFGIFKVFQMSWKPCSHFTYYLCLCWKVLTPLTPFFKFKYAVYSRSILLMRFSRCLAFLLDLQCFPFPVFSFVFPLVFLSLYWILLHILNLNFLFHLAVCVLLEFVFSNFFEYTYNYPSCSWASFFIY